MDAFWNLRGKKVSRLELLAKGTLQYKSDMQMQLMFKIAGFVQVIITHFQGL